MEGAYEKWERLHEQWRAADEAWRTAVGERLKGTTAMERDLRLAKARDDAWDKVKEHLKQAFKKAEE